MAGLKHFVWDLPTRLFHWLLVILLGLSWWSAENGEMEWHYRSGLAICGLVLFRILWGFLGSSTSRFSDFLSGPGAVIRYLKGGHSSTPGHNPLGGWSVVAMLAVLVAQVTLGLFAVDVDGIESGPLSHMVSFDAGRRAADWHETVFTILQVLVAIHVLAILFYTFVKRQQLVGPMVSGSRAGSAGSGGEARRAPLWRFVLAAVLAALATWAIANGLRFG